MRESKTPRILLVLLAAGLLIAALVILSMSGGESEPIDDVEVTEVSVVSEDDPDELDLGLDSEVEVAAVERSVVDSAIPEPEPQGPPASWTEALGGITGRLVESDGTPIADMSVGLLGLAFNDLMLDMSALFAGQIKGLDLDKGEAITDEDGHFRFESVDPRSVHGLGVDLGGPRATLRFVDVSPNSGQDVDLGDIVMAPYITFTGRVVDLDDVPVPDARVRVSDLPPIVFEFGVGDLRADGGVLGQDDRNGGSSPNWVVIPFPSPVGRLIDRFPVPTTYTADDGTFELAGVPQGVVTMVIDKEDFVTLVKGPMPTGAAGGERSLGDLVLDEGDELIGRVEDHDGNPVAGAEVMIGSRQELSDEFALVRPAGRTDGEGRFHVLGVPDREQYIAARRENTVTWGVVEDVFPGGEEPVVRLEPEYDLKVTAYDPSGEVVPKPKIIVSEYPDEGAMFLVITGSQSQVSTKIEYQEDGSADLKGLGAGRYQLLVRADGFAVESTPANLTEGPQQLRVDLKHARNLRVTVTDAAEGSPVAFARIRALPRESGFMDFLSPVVGSRTNEQGTVELEGVDRAGCRLQVSHPGYALEEKLVESLDQEVAVSLKKGAVLVGRVHAGGRPPDMPRFVAVARDQFNQFPRFVVTDLEGSFRIAGLQGGEYNVAVFRRFANDRGVLNLFDNPMELSTPERSVEVNIPEGLETAVDIDLLGVSTEGPTARLNGRVLLNGTPAKKTRLSVIASGAWEDHKNTVTDANGNFDLGAVSIGDAGVVHLTVTPDGIRDEGWWGGSFYSQNLVLTDGEVRSLVIELRTGQLTGRVVSAANGEPVPTASVTIRTENSRDIWESMAIVENESGEQTTSPAELAPSATQQTTTEENGGFSFDLVPEGDYLVEIEAEKYQSQTVGPIRVSFGGAPPAMLVRLSQAVRVTGTLVLPDGVTADWISLQFTAQGETDSTHVWISSEDMAFETWELKAGSYEVECSIWVQESEEWLEYQTSLHVPEIGLIGVTLTPTPVQR